MRLRRIPRDTIQAIVSEIYVPNALERDGIVLRMPSEWREVRGRLVMYGRKVGGNRFAYAVVKRCRSGRAQTLAIERAYDDIRELV